MKKLLYLCILSSTIYGSQPNNPQKLSFEEMLRAMRDGTLSTNPNALPATRHSQPSAYDLLQQLETARRRYSEHLVENSRGTTRERITKELQDLKNEFYRLSEQEPRSTILENEELVLAESIVHGCITGALCVLKQNYILRDALRDVRQSSSQKNSSDPRTTIDHTMGYALLAQQNNPALLVKPNGQTPENPPPTPTNRRTPASFTFSRKS